jgi:hypothetical protein
MNQPPLALKRPCGFFAAGREVDEALTLLSDGAFKLFVYLCLHAERGSGRLRFRLADLARRLGKSPRSITSYLAELQRQDVCTVQAAVNQHHAGLIEIRDRFWPYHKQAAETALDAQAGYVDRVRKLFLSRACVAGGFTAADERLAAEWRQRGVPLEQVERAYLLGCARKYVALLNHPGGPLVSSLRYFSALLEEVAESPASPGYWQHLARQVEALERRWRNRTAAAAPTGHANFAPADSASTAQKQGETR